MKTEKVKQLEAISARMRELAEAKSLSDDEKAELETKLVEGKSLRDQIHAERASDEFTQTIAEEVQPSTMPAKGIALGRTMDGLVAVADRDGFKHAVEAWKSKQRDAKWGFDLGFKGSMDDLNVTAELNIGALGGTGDLPQYGGVIPPQYMPGMLEPSERAPQIASLFAQGTTASNLVRLVRETVTSNSAAVVTEGAHKPWSEIQVAPHDFPVRDIATLLPVTEDILEDVPAMASYLSMRLTKFVALAEEDEILNGDGTGAHLEGILETAGTTEADQGQDTLATAVMKLMAATFAASFIDPTWVVMSPTTWANYVTERETANGGLGAYLAGGASGAPSRRIWDLPITVSPALSDNVVLLGNPSAGMVFRKGGIRVESSSGYGTFFGEDLVAVRAKVRTAFALFRPQAIGVLHLGS